MKFYIIFSLWLAIDFQKDFLESAVFWIIIGKCFVFLASCESNKTQWKIESVKNVFLKLSFLPVHNGYFLQSDCQSFCIFVTPEFLQSSQN